LSFSMPIPVICPGCQARFSVSDKFAGKEGPCPKCKAKITIPNVTTDEVKIHVPEEFASGGKDSKGRAVLKPIARTETKVHTLGLVAGIASAVLILGICLLGRFSGKPGNSTQQALFFTIAVTIAPALAAAGYTFLRDQELEAYSGKQLWIRALICGTVFALSWAALGPLASSGILVDQGAWPWLIIAPMLIAIGGATALGSFDLDFGSGALNYGLYLITTLALRWAIGLPAVWQAVT
jgi:hypothetical protein